MPCDSCSQIKQNPVTKHYGGHCARSTRLPLVDTRTLVAEPGLLLSEARRVHRAEVQNYALSGAQVLWCFPVRRLDFRWIVLALSGLCVVAWVFVRVGAS